MSPFLLVGIGLRTTHIIWESIRRRVRFTLRAFHSLYPFHLSLSLTLPLSPSYLSLPLYISPSTFLSLSLLLSLFSLSFSLACLMDVFVLVLKRFLSYKILIRSKVIHFYILRIKYYQ